MWFDKIRNWRPLRRTADVTTPQSAPTSTTRFRTLPLRLTEDEHALVERWADQHGVVADVWIRTTLLRAIPDSFRSDQGRTRDWEQFLEMLAPRNGHSHGHSENVDGAPIDPQRVMQQLQQTRDEQRRLELMSRPRVEHVCLHIRQAIQPGCLGVCTAPIAPGRPCRWPASVAPQCEDFAPFRIARR